MSHILIVEDNPLDTHLATRLLEEAGFEVRAVADGRAGLEAVRQGGVDLVLTDLQMPEMNGLELVKAVRHEHSAVPVVLMTQNGSEEIAVEALQAGAAGYIPKRHLRRDVVRTLDDTLAVAGAQRHTEMLLRCLTRTEHCFVIDNDPDLTVGLIGYLQQSLAQLRHCDELTLLRLGVALREAIINAIHHGNLEVSSQLREQDDNTYFARVEERRRQSPYQERRVHVLARELPTEVVYVIRDEGPGFDPAQVPDPTSPANMQRVSGRGLFLIRTFMDKVSHNAAGNEITLVKRCGPLAA